MQKNILVLGGDGFIGSHLRDKHLELGDVVVSVDKNRTREKKDYHENYYFYHTDLIQKQFPFYEHIVKSYKINFVYNCVAIANPDFYVKAPLETFNLDFDLNKKIIDILFKIGIPFIHFSTCEVYGKNLDDKWNEKTTSLILGPTHKTRWIYAISKILLEQIIFANLEHKFEDSVVIIRPFNIIGHDIDWLPSENTDNYWKPRVFSCFMDALIYNKPIYIVEPGTQKRNYCYIDDAVDGIISILDNFGRCNGKVINIGNPNNSINIQELANMMILIFKNISPGFNVQLDDHYNRIQRVDGKKFFGSNYDDMDRSIPDISLIKDLTGWEPETNLRKTLEKSMKKLYNRDK